VRAFALAVLCASLVLAGCTVRFVPSPNMKPKEVLNLYVGLLIPKAEARRTARVGSKTVLIGDALKVGARNTFQQLFTNVYELQTRKQAAATPDLQWLLLPRVVSFQIDQNGQATVVLGARLTNLNDRLLMDSTWSGSSSPGVTAGQGAAGKGSIERASSEAFEAAFKQMATAVLLSRFRTSYR
jgi:hypothetical protein